MPKGRPQKDFDVNQARKLRRTGLGFDEIGEQLGASGRTVKRRLQEYDRPPVEANPDKFYQDIAASAQRPDLDAPGEVPNYELSEPLLKMLDKHYQAGEQLIQAGQDGIDDLKKLRDAWRNDSRKSRSTKDLIDDEAAEAEAPMTGRAKLHALCDDVQRFGSIQNGFAKILNQYSAIISTGVALQREATGVDSMQSLDTALKRVQLAGMVVSLPANVPTMPDAVDD